MSPRRFLGGLLTATLALSALVLPVPAGAQWLRLEDPIRQQERWQRNFDLENERRARDARDEARDREILRNQEDILRELRNQEVDRDWREQERQRERQEDRERKRSPDCVYSPAYSRYYGSECPR